MKDNGYAVFGLAILAIPVIFTIYTVFVIYDITIDTQTIIYYFMAVCFVASVVYRYKGKKNKSRTIRQLAGQSPNANETEARTEIDKDKDPYPDSLFN